MRSPAADEPRPVPSSAARSAAFAPTSVDLMLDRVQRVAPKLTRASDRLLVGATALLVVTDVAVWATHRPVDPGRLSMSIAFLVPCIGVLATVAVILRPRNPVPPLLALSISGIGLTLAVWAIGTSLPPSFAALFALALLTTRVLRQEASGTAVLLAVLAGSAVAAEALRPMVSTAAYLLVLCEGAFGVAVGAGVYLRWSDWRRVAAEEAARTEERLEIARELHDLVGHYVTGIVVQAQAARHVARHQPEAAAMALERIEAAGADAMVAMRRMVGGLRDDGPRTSGDGWDELDESIAQAIARAEPLHATIDPDVRTAARSLGPSVHRIVVESLTNVRRHAREVTSIEVEVELRPGHVLVSVHDDGASAGPMAHDTFGIVGMRERAESFGGSLMAGPAADGGWLVRAQLPLEDPR